MYQTSDEMNLIPLLLGLGLGFAIAILAHLIRFERDRSFYPTILIVIASYYVLFAVMSGESVVVELLIACFFSAIAIAAAVRWGSAIGWGILLHGVFDFTRNGIIGDGGAPHWWPEFCGGIDVALGVCLIWATHSGWRSQQHPPTS
ncbi:MAG: hypothetical protein ACSHXK_09090 [Oceanococcus sp.]